MMSKDAANSTQRQHSLAGADLARVGAVLGVILIHASQWPSKAGAVGVYESITILSRFAVPTFVVLSGLLLELNVSRQKRGYFRTRLRRSLLPFAVWGPVFIITALLFTQDLSWNIGAIANYIAGGIGHLFFLLLIAQFYCVYLVWPHRGRYIAICCAVLLPCQLLLSVWRLEASSDSPLVSLALWHGFELFPFWIGYFSAGVAVGWWFRKGHSLGLPWTIASLVVASAAGFVLVHEGNTSYPNGGFATGTGAFLRPLMLPFALAVTVLLIQIGAGLPRLPAQICRGISRVATASLGIYILHPLVLYAPGRLLFPLLSASLPWSVVGLAILLPATLVLSEGVVRILARTPLQNVL